MKNHYNIVVRECGEEPSCVREQNTTAIAQSYYDAHQADPEQLAIARQLIAEARKRNVAITLEDLGILVDPAYATEELGAFIPFQVDGAVVHQAPAAPQPGPAAPPYIANVLGTTMLR